MPLESWPEWACNEDGEVFWIRRDVAQKNDLSLIPELAQMNIGAARDVEKSSWAMVLVPDGPVTCWLDLAPEGAWDWSEWMLHELADDDQADDALVYERFSTEMAKDVDRHEVVFGATS